MSREYHVGCGGRVRLAHEVWRCERCCAAPVPVADVRRTRRAAIALIFALAACGAADDVDLIMPDSSPGCDGTCAPDAPPDGDAGPDAITCLGTCSVDAGGTLPANSPCEPTFDECALGLTCRIRAAHDGICRPTGPLAEGAPCTSVDQCGSNMACLPGSPGTMRCMVVCDVAAPAIRCDASQTCTAFWGADTGVCT